MSQGQEILIVKTGETLPSVKAARGDFEVWFRNALASVTDRLHVTNTYQGEPLPDPSAFSGVIVTGSPGMVTERQDWSESAAAWLRKIVESDQVPVLGVCYGHQLMAHGLGGEVGPNPRGRESGTMAMRLAEAGGPFPAAGEYFVHMSHVESVLVPPSDAQSLAATDLEPHAVLQFGPRQWGVQFHPEFDADIMRGYVETRRQILLNEGIDPDETLANIRETPELSRIVAQFAADSK